MQVGFICPDGEPISHECCLAKCRMAWRCATLPTLRKMANVRQYAGVPSVTQCLMGTMEAYLRIVIPYFVSPQSLAFSLHGTDTHEQLEAWMGEDDNNDRMTHDDSTGEPDLVTPNGDGTHDVVDYKTWGSYAVLKALKDDCGDAAGKVVHLPADRMPVIGRDEDATWQINKYAHMLTKEGLTIRDMLVQIVVRDGGTWMAKKRGVDRNIIMARIPRLEPTEVDEFFAGRSKALADCLSACRMPAEPCSPKERWDGYKCKEYCPVSHACPIGGGTNAGN